MSPRPLKAIFADPKMDLPFKKAFGSAEHKDLLIALLNALLRLPADARIVDLEYLPPEQLPPYAGLKLSHLDVKCTDARGTRYLIEMQVLPVDGFEKRVVLNACKAYVEQLGKSQHYAQLNDIIAVNICNFNLFSDKVPLLSRWQMQEQHSGERGLGQLQYVFLELPKYQAGDHPHDIVDQWAYFFRAAETLWEIPRELAKGPIGQALEVVRKMNFTDFEWRSYEQAKMAEQDYHGGITYAHRQGVAEGEARGEARALRQGVLTLCEVLQIPVSAKRRTALQQLDGKALAELTEVIRQQRAWPSETPARSSATSPTRSPARSGRSPKPALS